MVQNIYFRASVVIFCQKLFNYLDSGPSVTEIIKERKMAINLTWKFVEPELDAIAAYEGRVVVIVSSDAKIDQLGRRVNKLTRGAVARAIEK